MTDAGSKLTRSQLYLVATMSAGFFFFASTLVLPHMLVPNIMEKFAIRPMWTGVLASAISAGYISAVLGAGMLVDHIGHKAVFVIGAVLTGSAFAGVGFVNSFWAALALLFVSGAGGGAIEVVPNIAMMQLGPGKSLRMLNIVHLFFGVGAFVGPMAASAAMKRGLPWTWLFPIASAAYLLLILMTLPCQFPPRVRTGESFVRDSMGVIGSPMVLAISLLLAVYVGVELGVSTWMTKYLETFHGIARTTGGQVLAFYWLASGLGRLIVATLAPSQPPARQIIVMGGLGAIVLAVGVGTAQPVLAATCLALTALFIGPVYPTAMSWGGRLCPHRPGTAAGLMALGGSVGGTFFPWLMAGLTEVTDNLRLGMASYISLCGAMIPCTLLVTALVRRQKVS